MNISKNLKLQITFFFGALLTGRYNDPHLLAKEFERLAGVAWDEVDETIQGAIRID